MRVTIGQEWELPSAASGDPLVLRVVEVMDRYAVVHTVRRSAPTVVLDRSEMWLSELVDSGVLIAGPGALGARRREQRARHLADLLTYAARRVPQPLGNGEVRFDGKEVVALVAEDEGVSEADARAMLRDALAELGGHEITTPYDYSYIVYVLPASAVRRAA